MFATNAATEVRAIAALARQLHVTLPGDLDRRAEHLEALGADRRATTAPTVEAIAADLARHLGDPDAMTNATGRAAAELATAEARDKITRALVDRCALTLRNAMRTNADAITSAFADALAPSLDALATDAGTLPPGFRPEHAATLTPDQYRAWVCAQAAQAQLEAVRSTLRPLYSTAADDMLTAGAVRALAYIAPPEDLSYENAHTFARALAGTRHGGSELGPVSIGGVFAPTACAHLGASFVWAGANETAARAAKVSAAGVQPVRTPEPRRRAVSVR